MSSSGGNNESMSSSGGNNESILTGWLPTQQDIV
jgi:hypothetical protein